MSWSKGILLEMLPFLFDPGRYFQPFEIENGQLAKQTRLIDWQTKRVHWQASYVSAGAKVPSFLAHYYGTIQGLDKKDKKVFTPLKQIQTQKHVS